MQLSRRAFGALISSAILDPEKLLWKPGEKLISIPSEINSKNWYFFCSTECLNTVNIGLAMTVIRQYLSPQQYKEKRLHILQSNRNNKTLSNTIVYKSPDEGLVIKKGLAYFKPITFLETL